VPATVSLDVLERALDQTGRLIDGILPDQQAHLPTPCGAWDVRALVNHIVYDVHVFVSMLTGDPRGAPDADLVDDDWPGAYRAAAATLLATWHGQDLGRTLRLPFGELPVTWAIGQHVADLAVHAWDVAQATGQSTELDPLVGQAALDWGRANLKPEYRGSAFGPEVAVAVDAPLYARLAAFFGRAPAPVAH
jgi:uncharacterized protein (TIGR03086 family)